MTKSRSKEKAPKTAAEAEEADLKSRRDFMTLMGAATAVGAAEIVLPGIAQAKPPATPEGRLDAEKLQQLESDPKTLQDFTESVDEVVKDMMQDPHLSALLLENTDSVQLINLYNQHRRLLDGLLGKTDGRTKQGRYKKMIVAAELFLGVSGIDEVRFIEGSEEITYVGDVETLASGCSGCDTGGTLLGCCIVHFWGWSCSGSCSPCNDSATTSNRGGGS